MNGKDHKSNRKSDLENQYLNTNISKAQKEIELIDKQIQDFKKPWWKKPAVYSFYGAVFAGIALIVQTMIIECNRQKDLKSKEIHNIITEQIQLLRKIDERELAVKILNKYEESFDQLEEVYFRSEKDDSLRAGVAFALRHIKYPRQSIHFLASKIAIEDKNSWVHHHAYQALLSLQDTLSVNYLLLERNAEFQSKTITNPTDNSEMVFIPPGSFWMGDDRHKPDESPRHLVFLNGYYFDKFEITNEQFSLFVKETGYKLNGEQLKFDMNEKNFPVTQVNWYDANEYAKWANKRLPTEAEWEKAARGGLLNSLFPWGNQIDSTLINKYFKSKKAVGSYKANRYGIFDMEGNVRESCFDFYDYYFYQNSPDENPRASKDLPGSPRVIRGSAWSYFDPQFMRCSYRWWSYPIERNINVGFRCVKDSK